MPQTGGTNGRNFEGETFDLLLVLKTRRRGDSMALTQVMK
jgi:hypothetical protein